MGVNAVARAVSGKLTGRLMAARATLATVPALQYWRVQRAMLQREIADGADVRLRTIQRLEAGGAARLDTIRRLATLLAVTPAELMRQPPTDPQ